MEILGINMYMGEDRRNIRQIKYCIINKKITIIIVFDESYHPNKDKYRAAVEWITHCTDKETYSWVSILITSQVANTSRSSLT